MTKFQNMEKHEKNSYIESLCQLHVNVFDITANILQIQI